MCCSWGNEIGERKKNNIYTYKLTYKCSWKMYPDCNWETWNAQPEATGGGGGTMHRQPQCESALNAFQPKKRACHKVKAYTWQINDVCIKICSLYWIGVKGYTHYCLVSMYKVVVDRYIAIFVFYVYIKGHISVPTIQNVCPREHVQ